jgi:hypothetical protein
MRLAPLALAALAAASPLAAQVGNDPATSPYRELPFGNAITVHGGWFGGSGGRLEVGPHNGPVYGARFQLRNNRFLSLGVGLSQANLERRVLDPFVEVANRDKGIVDQNVTIIEGILQFNLTGAKSWRRLAPFAGFAGGVAFASDTPADTSGYRFGTKFQFAPFAGLRIAPTPRLNLRLEARANVWKLNYPESYSEEPPLQPGTPDAPNAILVDGSIAEWVLSPWYLVGISWYF